MSEKHSDTGIIKARFPAYAWLPRWTRTYLTPQNVLAIAVGLFSAGVWWDNRQRSQDLKDIRKDLGAITEAMSPECVRRCLLRTEDLNNLERRVGEPSKLQQGVDVEYNTELKPIAPPSPAAFEPPKKPARLK